MPPRTPLARLASLALFLVACDRGAPPAASDGSVAPLAHGSAAPTSSGSGAMAGAPALSAAAPASRPAPAAVSDATYEVFGGTVDREPVTLVLERRDDDVRVGVARGDAAPLLFRGKAHARSGFEASTRPVSKAERVRLSAHVDADGKLEGALVEPGAKRTTKLSLVRGAAGVAPTSKEAVVAFVGTLGGSKRVDGRRIRARLKHDGEALWGVYRYAKSTEDLALAGKVVPTTGAFELTEKDAKDRITGRFRGVLVGGLAALGTWSSPDGARKLPLELEWAASYPEAVALADGGKVVPQERHVEPAPGCSLEILHPTFEGLAEPRAKASLDRALRKELGVDEPFGAKDCPPGGEEPHVAERAYLVTASRPRFVAFELTSYAFTGGAHGNAGFRCVVADTKKGTVATLGSGLGPEALPRLGALVNAALKKEHRVERLTEAGFFADVVPVSKDTALCATERSGALVLEVLFNPYEVAPWAMGAPRVRVEAAEARALFVPGSLGADVFR